MSGHTPGPWEASGLLINTVEPSTIDGAGRTIHHWKQIAEVRLFGGHRWDSPECHANASLIAAAPELLAALRRLVDHCEVEALSGANENFEYEWLDACRAIAKAEGSDEE
jgi:hypothetical protein